MSNSSKQTTMITVGSIGICFPLFLVFLILKLTGIISWSWWWVTAPLWGGIALVIASILIGLLILGIWYIWRNLK